MICPECEKTGQQSKVYVGYMTSTAMAFHPFYDEGGNYHSHNGNYLTTRYSCSKGHQFVEKLQSSCPHGDYEGYNEVTVL